MMHYLNTEIGLKDTG